MCNILKIGPDPVAPNISLEFERDASTRAWRFVVVNDPRGEARGVAFYCLDNGRIAVKRADGSFDYLDVALVDGVEL